MAETEEIVPDSPSQELRSVVLRIPGEHFFCETIDVPRNLDPDDLLAFALQSLVEEGISPYPTDQLSWGYFASIEHGKLILFGASSFKLRQMGWQDLEVFQRVFPSFVSLFDQQFEKPTICFLRHEETLTAASFEADCPVPAQLFSLPLTPQEEEENRFDETRGKLLSLFDLEQYEISPQVLVSGDVVRTNDGFFEFEHSFDDEDSEDPNVTVKLSAELLWDCDVRSFDFKLEEQARRLWVRRRWTGFLAWGVGVAALVVVFVGISIFENKALARDAEATDMGAQVPLVLESQKLLEKLQQNKLGGIDPFGSLGRLAAHRGGQGDQPHLWFTNARFASRNEIILEGQGQDVSAVNSFIKGLVENGVGKVQTTRSGELKRKIVSTAGKTTFKIELLLNEEKVLEQASATPVTIPADESGG
jgi:hypothetical protein